MTVRVKNLIVVLFLAGVGGLAGTGLWMQHRSGGALLIGPSPRASIMSTPQFNITLVLSPGQAWQAEEILNSAERSARLVEQRMNIYDPASPLSKFNSAGPGLVAALSGQTRSLLGRARELWLQTGGAFDVTARPVFLLWKQAGRAGILPGKAKIRQARQASRWGDIELTPAGAKKNRRTAGVDLGGLAKGLAIDLAAETMMQAGALGGVVDIGGDVRCFGQKPNGKPWRVAIRNPFARKNTGSARPAGPGLGLAASGGAVEAFVILAVRSRAVCTSGNYERYSVIAGSRFSHIVDPRTGLPAQACPSVTVVAGDAVTADAWATALSVLGPAGFKLIPPAADIEAMIILGPATNPKIKSTPGFDKYLAKTNSQTPNAH